MNSFTVTYIGGPTAIIEISGARFMTDPTLDPEQTVYHSESLTVEKTKGPASADISQIDVVLLSHDQHFDNLDIAGRLLLHKVCRIYTTQDGARRLKAPAVGLLPWQSETYMAPDGTAVTITAAPARHGPAGFEKIQGEVTGFLLSVGGDKRKLIYLTGNTVFYEGVLEVARRFDPSYVFLFAGAARTKGAFYVTMDTNGALDTALAFPNATIIPLNYDGWKHYTQTEKDIEQSFRLIGIEQRLKILKPGVAATFPL